MQTTITTLLALLASTAFAGPIARDCTAGTATIAFTEDTTGRSVPKTFCLDGTAGEVPDMYATSASLNGDLAARPSCTLNLNGAIFYMTSRNTWVDLDENPGGLTPTRITGGTVVCRPELGGQ